MKNISLYLGSILLIPASVVLVAIGNPEEFSPLPSYGQVIKHKYYTLSYNEQHEQANWVSYTMTSDMLEGDIERGSYFSKDDKVKTESVSTDEYKKSGYDRGHLVPAVDMSFSEEAMDQTFITSNISPQHPSLNRGIWRVLESTIRQWVERDKELHITCAGVLKEGLEKIGYEDKVSVPEYFYKVILDNKEPELKAIGFLFPNKKCEGNIMDYAITIDSVESLTGLDFYPILSDSLEEALESNINPRLW